MNLDCRKLETMHAAQTDRVFRWWDYPVFFGLSSLSITAIAYFFCYWLTLNDWHTSPIIMAIMTLMLSVVLVNNQGRWFLLPWMRQPKPWQARSGWKIGVVTTFVSGAESLEMLEDTVRALRDLDYPHDTWILDESDDEEVKNLCQRLGAHHFSRKSLSHYQTEGGRFQSHSKHGNYNAWLYEIGFDRYKIVVTFDPDHVPNPNFLSEILGYFDDPKVGYVQAAQAYYNQHVSFIARGAAEETYAYYSSIQMASYGLGYPIIVGCHNAHRVSALKQVGGFPSHDADDLFITLLYRALGWQGVYVPKILARGLTPVDWSGYLGQQRRWARSVLDLKLRSYPKLSANVPLKTRLINLLHGLNYLHKSLLIPMGLLLMAHILATGMVQNVFTGQTVLRLSVLAGALQLCEFYRQRFYLDLKNERGLHWRAGLLQFAKWPYLLAALFDVIVGRRLPYTLTPKVKLLIKPPLLMWPQMAVIVLIGTAWMIGFLNGSHLLPFLHLSAAAVVTASLILLLTEQWTFPSPYTGSTARAQRLFWDLH